MPKLKIIKEAKDDLLRLRRELPEVEEKIRLFLVEAVNDSALLDTFNDDDYGKVPPDRYHVRMWVSQQQKGRNLWRLKIWTLEDQQHHYRVVYAFYPPDTFVVLGVTKHDYRQPEEFDYKDDDDFTIRVVAAYYRVANKL